MILESSQWIALVLMSVLLLGVYQQLALMSPNGALSIAPGPEVGKRLPKQLLNLIGNASPDLPRLGATAVFVSENCSACQRLLADIEHAIQLDRLTTRLVLVARTPTSGFRSALGELGLPLAVDESGASWRAAGISATPLVVGISRDGRVRTREIAHHVDSIASEVV